MAAAAPSKCLETNVYAKPGKGGVNGITPEDLNTEPLHYLLEKIYPALVIAHGSTAKRYLEQQDLKYPLKCVSHFSSQYWFDIALIDTLRELRG